MGPDSIRTREIVLLMDQDQPIDRNSRGGKRMHASIMLQINQSPIDSRYHSWYMCTCVVAVADDA